MLRFENVATPLTAVTVFVPDSVPGRSVPPLWPMAIVTEPLKLVTRLPPASSAVTWTAGIAISGGVVFGWTVNPRCGGGLSASTVESHVSGDGQNQFHVGFVVPAVACTAYAVHVFRKLSAPMPM